MTVWGRMGGIIERKTVEVCGGGSWPPVLECIGGMTKVITYKLEKFLNTF